MRNYTRKDAKNTYKHMIWVWPLYYLGILNIYFDEKSGYWDSYLRLWNPLSYMCLIVVFFISILGDGLKRFPEICMETKELLVAGITRHQYTYRKCKQ